MPQSIHLVDIPAAKIREVLGHLPLLEGLPQDLLDELALRARTFHVRDTTVLYTPEDITPWVNYLFIVISGRGQQYGVAPDHVPWPNRLLRPGAVFGRHTTLLSMPPEITVEVARGSILYGLEVEDLAYVVSRWPELYDRLIPLARMRRLRAMPALALLSDDHIRRLCDHVQVVTLNPGEPLPTPSRPTLWMVAEGQLSPIPRSPYPVGTTGRTVVITQENTMAVPPPRALRTTTLFALPLALWEHLMEHADPEGRASRDLLTFPDVRAYLQHTPPFHRLPPTLQTELAGYMAWIFTPPGQTLYRAGDQEPTLYILVDGMATWRAPQHEGRNREGTLYPGQAVGVEGLLHGTRTTFSLTAARPSFWLRLSRNDLDRADRGRRRPISLPSLSSLFFSDEGNCLDENASLWHCLGGTPPATTTGERRTGWLGEGERVLWLDRQHMLFFALRVTPWIALASLALVLLPTLPGGWGRHALGAGLALVALWLIYLVVDYINDFYALTDRRVVHRERLWGIRERWEEIPLDQIQDGTVDQGFLGRIFDYGTLVIASAASQGTIVMRHIPHPMDTLSRILDERLRARSALRGMRDQITEEHTLRHMYPRLEATWPDTATGEEQRQDTKATTVSPLEVLHRLIENDREPHIPWAPLTFWQAGEALYWRKHHVNLVARTWRSTLILALLLFALPFLIYRLNLLPFALHHPSLLMVWGLLIIAAAGWLLWEYDDWRNDLYILTPSQVVDVEKRPMFARDNRRAAPLSRVQTVQMNMSSPFAHLFNYGDVIIKTAAEEGDLTFHFVPAPRQVVHTIEAYREAWQRRQHEQEFMRQARAMARAMDIYHQLRSGDHPVRPRVWTTDM